MTPITKQQVEELIGRLADKGLTFGCLVECGNERGRLGRVFNNVAGGRRLEVFDGKDKQLLFPDPNELVPHAHVKILGHPILLGDVLEKIQTIDHKKAVATLRNCKVEDVHGDYDIISPALLLYWQPCGFTKSLQEIAEGATWEWVPVQVPDDEFDLQDGPFKTVQVLKDEKVEALVSFLISLDLLREGKFNNNAK